MKIAVYSFCFNEKLILPYFFRHYQKYTHDITIFDNYSTDGSVEIIKQNQGKVIPYDSGNELRDDIIVTIKNNCWKEKKGTDTDWVIIVDIDELLYHPNLIDFLAMAKEEKASLFVARGYSMISETLPTSKGQIYDEVNLGIIDDVYSKAVMFDPNSIEDINYSVGSHYFNPTGKSILLFDPALKLLHFHYLSLERHLAKVHERVLRLGVINRKYDWGNHYLKSDEQLEADFRNILEKAQKVI
jgi:glycosyltransferase involved in cell wall biosynthesis